MIWTLTIPPPPTPTPTPIKPTPSNNGEEKEEDEEDDDSFFPDFDLDNIGKGDSYDEKAKNIGEELKKLFELNDNIKEEINGEEEEDDTGNDITEKYAEMMKDANETWIEIVRVEIYRQDNFYLSPLSIVAAAISNINQLGLVNWVLR